MAVAPFLLLLLAAPASGYDDTLVDPVSSRWLRAASDNAFRGGYSGELLFVRCSFTAGTDSLRGTLKFDDPAGERRIRLEGRRETCEWWSVNFGQEQWWMDDRTERLRRIPHRSLKKPLFGSLLTYEDLLKFPAGFLEGFRSCKKLAESDTACAFALSLEPVPGSRYGALEVTLGKRPVLLRRVAFFDFEGRKIKSLEVSEYLAAPGGKFLPAALSLYDADSLVSLRVFLRHPRISSPPSAGRDHTGAASAALSRMLGKGSLEARIEAAEADTSADAGEAPGDSVNGDGKEE